MLEYSWGNPSTIILTGNEGGATTEPDETHRQILEHNYTLLPNTTAFSNHHHFNPPQMQQHHPFFDPRSFTGASFTSFSPSPSSMLSLDPTPPINRAHCMFGLGHGLGLGLGLGLNYFTSSNDNIMNGLYPRCKSVGESNSSVLSNTPRCQVEGCNMDLSEAKHYHRRHKVCEFHSKAPTVIAAGLTQRFCQQCSRFHLLSEFDNGKRSCRKRLADHNRRRRKIQQPTQETQKSQPTSDNVSAGSSLNSEVQSSSSVTVTVSPPDFFGQRQNQNRGSLTSSGSLFYSSG